MHENSLIAGGIQMIFSMRPVRGTLAFRQHCLCAPGACLIIFSHVQTSWNQGAVNDRSGFRRSFVSAASSYPPQPVRTESAKVIQNGQKRDEKSGQEGNPNRFQRHVPTRLLAWRSSSRMKFHRLGERAPHGYVSILIGAVPMLARCFARGSALTSPSQSP